MDKLWIDLAKIIVILLISREILKATRSAENGLANWAKIVLWISAFIVIILIHNNH